MSYLSYRDAIIGDDEWCDVCGESLPCPCDDMEDGWFTDGDDYEDELPHDLNWRDRTIADTAPIPPGAKR